MLDSTKVKKIRATFKTIEKSHRKWITKYQNAGRWNRKKMNLKKEEKNQANLGKPYKPALIYQIYNQLNYRHGTSAQ